MAFVLDPAHTNIDFSAKHMMVTNVRGTFKKFSGELDLDEQHPENSRVQITIDVASIDTGMEPRDNHLRSADFFDVEHYPTITFTSKRVERRGEDHGRIYGDLTIRDVTRGMYFDVTFEGQTKDMEGNRRGGFSASTSISRKDFGLNWNVALESGGWLVSDTIKIAVEAEVIEKVAAPVA
jgi:polyisoprenoid-binding protein YceI